MSTEKKSGKTEKVQTETVDAPEVAKKARAPADNRKDRTRHADPSDHKRCDPRKCQETDLLQLSRSARGKEKWTIIDKIDMQHLKSEHFRLYSEHWCERAVSAEESLEKALEQNHLLTEENRQLKDGSRGLGPQSAKTAAKEVSRDLLVDPKNHVDGFCDALIQGPDRKTIWKCTDSCRYGKNLCGLHTDHRYTVGSVNSSTMQAAAPTVNVVAAAPNTTSKQTKTNAKK